VVSVYFVEKLSHSFRCSVYEHTQTAVQITLTIMELNPLSCSLAVCVVLMFLCNCHFALTSTVTSSLCNSLVGVQIMYSL